MDFKNHNPILRFIDRFLLPLLTLKRRIHFRGKKGRESLAEHIVQLLYFTEFFIKKYHLNLDIHKVREYILSHDMSEPFTLPAVKSGFDICCFSDPANVLRDKKRTENHALNLIRKEFPEFEDLAKSSEQYEKQEDDESNFVKACDAFLPILNVILDNGRTHRIDGITFKRWREDREWRIKKSQIVWDCYMELIFPLLTEYQKTFYTKEPEQGELF